MNDDYEDDMQILRPFLLRRVKQDVEKEIPSKEEMTIYVGLTIKQIELYRKVIQTVFLIFELLNIF